MIRREPQVRPPSSNPACRSCSGAVLDPTFSACCVLRAACWLSTLHRPHDLDRLALCERRLLPLRVPHYLAVDGDGDPAALAVEPDDLNGVRDGRALGKLLRAAVHLHDQVVTSSLAGAAASPGALSAPK